MSRRQKPNLEEDLEEYREWLEKDIPINGDWIEEINCHSYEMRSIKISKEWSRSTLTKRPDPGMCGIDEKA